MYAPLCLLSNTATKEQHVSVKSARRSHTHTHTQPFNGLWSGTTRVGRYQKKHSPTHTHPDHRTSFIIFLHLQRSMPSSLFIVRAWQSSRRLQPLSRSSLVFLMVLDPQLHTPYISSPNHHLLFAAQPVLLQYQCYVIHTKSLSQLLTYSLLSQRDDQYVNYLCQDEEWGGLGWTSRAGCGDGKFVADGNYYAASYVHMRPTATDGVAWSVHVGHTGELCKNGWTDSLLGRLMWNKNYLLPGTV